MSRCALLVLIMSLAGCRCRPGPVDPVELGFRVAPAELEFGRVLEGSSKTLTLTLSAETRAPVSVALSTEAPFATGAEAQIPGGSSVDVQVTFNAGSTEEERVLKMTVGDGTAEVRLHGIGVRPPACVPSGECILSAYSLEEDRCIETPAPDDSACDPSSICLEQGRCRGGECLGIARRCDDGDLCTDDACSMDVGCVHTPHSCPDPTAACMVATCDSRTGCGEGPAPDLTPCGTLDCVNVHYCFEGSCRTEPTPDGLPCSAAIACLPEATCQDQVCTRVLEGDWNPDWSARLPAEPVGDLASIGSNLFFSMCRQTPDAGSLDAGALDGGDDAGTVDAGSIDAGITDGGLDAGALGLCSLTSYTGTGFERFTTPFEDDRVREVRAAGNAGVLLWSDAGLELRSQMSGALRFGLDAPVGRSQWALGNESVFVNVDAGLHEWTDAGLRFLADVSQEAVVIRGDALFAWDADAGLLTRVELLADGGTLRSDVSLMNVSSEWVLTADGLALLPAMGRVRFETDGGVDVLPWNFTDAGTLLERQTMAASGTMNVFFERCATVCETWVRNVDVLTGATRFEGRVLRGDVPARIVESTLFNTGRGVFGSLIREEQDGGSRAYFKLFIEGEEKALCRLPVASGAVELAEFTSSSLVVTSRRADGGVVLESFGGLGALPLQRNGWGTPTGVGGSRSDR
ncbi:MAG: hypothetical protein ACO1OB_10885 [Archangium sp.]